MRPIIKACISLLLLFALTPFICFAQNQNPSLFQGEINENNINVRCDSTVNAKIICVLNRGEPVEVVRDLYEWYKIRLPKTAPSFIKKDLVSLIDDKTGKVLKDNVNIRLGANESSPILGRSGKNEVINITGENAGWYKIEPLSDSFGWVHKKFVNKAVTIKRAEEASLPPPKAPEDNSLIIEGVIKPYGKVIKRLATHKLFTMDNKVFLLKGNREGLNSLNYHKVKVTGKPIHSPDPKYTTIEIVKIEAID